MLSYECLLCVLVLIQGFRRFKSDSSIFRSGKRLVNILIRDSIIYFLVCVFHFSLFLSPFFPIRSRPSHGSSFFLPLLFVVNIFEFETDIFSLPLNIYSICVTYLTCLLVWAFARVSPFAATFIIFAFSLTKIIHMIYNTTKLYLYIYIAFIHRSPYRFFSYDVMHHGQPGGFELSEGQ